MNWLRAAARRWGISVLIACAILGFAGSLIAGAYLLSEQRKQNSRQLEQESQRRADQARELALAQAQSRVIFRALCFSVYRKRQRCRRVEKGIILDPKLSVDEINAKLAHLGPTTITRLFIGKPGARGEVGLGIRGPAGSPGARGARGATGSRGVPGAQGQRGAQGAQGPRGERGERGPGGTGPPGPRGATGATGPPGPPGGNNCPGHWVLSSIPAVGEAWICKP
jgi:hypothetical protein